MPEWGLRAYAEGDVAALARVDSEYEDFGYRSTLRPAQGNQWGEPGGLVVTVDGAVAGSVSWYRPEHGPFEGSRAFGIGIGLFPEHRGQGLGRWAQHELTRRIFLCTPANRVEASTDVENIAEQRALAAIGFTREGVNRGAQWRLGRWHDMVMFARLRSDPGPADPVGPASPAGPAAAPSPAVS